MSSLGIHYLRLPFDVEGINEQREFFTKEIKSLKNNQLEMLGMKNTMNEIKNNVGSLKNRVHIMEDRIRNLEDRNREMLQVEEERKLTLKRNKEIL